MYTSNRGSYRRVLAAEAASPTITSRIILRVVFLRGTLANEVIMLFPFYATQQYHDMRLERFSNKYALTFI